MKLKEPPFPQPCPPLYGGASVAAEYDPPAILLYKAIAI